MPPLTAEQVLARWTQRKLRRVKSDPLLEDCATFYRPSQLGFLSDTTPPEGRKRTEGLFDSTGIDAVETLALSLAGGLSNEALRWFDLRMSDEALNQDDAVAEWLEDTTTRLLTALGQSNFYAEILEIYEDLGAFGQAALLVEENPITGPGFAGLRFEAWPLRAVWISEDGQGRVTAIDHRLTMGAAAAAERWPTTLPPEIRQRAATHPNDPVDLLHAYYPDPDRPRQWLSHVIELGRRVELEASPTYDFPVAYPRWRTATGEIYARGPGHTALPDMKSLNRHRELELKAHGKVVDPPLVATDRGVTSTVRLNPGGTTYIRPGATLTELQPNLSKFQITEAAKADFVRRIYRVFFQDALQLRETGPEMTAREVIVRYEIMQRRFAPTLGRLIPSLFTTVIERVFGLLYRAGALLPLPPQLQGQPWTVRYESPLARAQRLSEVDAVEAFLVVDVATAVQVFGASVLDGVDGDALLHSLGQRRGVAPTILRDQRQIDQRRAQRADLERQQQAKEDASMQAEALGKLAPLVAAEAKAGGAGAARVAA